MKELNLIEEKQNLMNGINRRWNYTKLCKTMPSL